MRKYILISIILVCAYGCGKENPKEKMKELENENNNLGLRLQKLNTELEASSALVEEVNALMMDIQATENKIEERKDKLYSAKEVEDTVGKKEEILNSIQKLYDDLNIHRKKADELQRKLYAFRATETKNYEEISSLKKLVRERKSKVLTMGRQLETLKKYVTQLEKKQEELTNEIGHLKSELSVKDNEILKKDNEISKKDNEISKKDNEISKKEREIKNLHQEINTIFFVIGNSKELRRKKIIDKKGIFIKNFVLGPDVTLAGFKQGKSATHTKLRVVGKIKKLLPFRNKNHYDLSYGNGVSLLNIKDSKNFWLQKYLVVVTN
ncbi:MAG: hypothetical protein ACYSWS_08465 [Planctomycetota bacterium]